MPIEMKGIESKLEKLDEMLDEFDKDVQSLNTIIDLPQATGLIQQCQDQMIKTLSTLKNEGIKFWLEGHTLLAVCRTGNLLPWETSVEIGMLADDWIAFVESKLMTEGKFKLENETTIVPFDEPQMGALKPQVKVRRWLEDNGIMRPFDDKISEVEKELILPLVDGTLEDRVFSIPCKSWKFLEIQFGKDWKKTL